MFPIMKQYQLLFKWSVLVICIFIQGIHAETEKLQWSKPEQSLSVQNNDWIPVQGKCSTCRPNRDLESQSTDEQIDQVLTPPRSPNIPSVPSSAAPLQQLQFPINKQPRILPFGSNSPQFNSPFVNTEGKLYQAQSTKLYPQELQKPFYQFETAFGKQPYSISSQQVIPQSPVISQTSISQQRFPIGEPYPFTLPLKGFDVTTPKVFYQPKIRFPESEPPKIIPTNKITSQNTDEIQLLYVPIEATQRGRKTMKEVYNQNQYQPPLPQGFVAPQYNFQYSPIPKQPENQFYFPSNISPATNYLHLNPISQQRPETTYTNLTKNLLQPYFTISGLYSSLPQIQSFPNKQELPYYNMLQPGLYNTNSIKTPEQIFNAPPPISQISPRPVQPVPPSSMFLQNIIPNTVSTIPDVYAPTTPEVTKNTDYVTEQTGSKGTDSSNKNQEFGYQFVTSSPQISASQNQQFISDNKLALPQQNASPFTQNAMTSKTPQLKTSSQTSSDETTISSYPVPHQPPLSFYMEKIHNPKINDVLYLLKDAKTIPVLDTVESDPPQVFVGPSELPPPKGYIKFELPYLSSLDYNRIERMIDRLPFFVAPLNFKPPPGYSKIPFPAPHIGSVVLSNTSSLQESLHHKSFDQKYKSSTVQSLSALPELSTITPQLTSQINSLLETPVPGELTSFKNIIPASPPASDPVTFKNYYNSQMEDITTKKSVFKSTYRPPSTTSEQPKRIPSRQRKPIYRGYPTTSTEVMSRGTTSTTETSQKFYTDPLKERDNYVEFTAKGKFNINNGNENAISSNPSSSESMYQVLSTTSSYPSQTEKNVYNYSNFFSKSEQNPYAQNLPVHNENVYETQTLTQNENLHSSAINSNVLNQNYPYYNSQSILTSTTDVKSELTVNVTDNSKLGSTQSPNFNFHHVKPLSQYNPYNNEQIQDNKTDALSIKTTNQPIQPNSNEFQFWTQNQFYKVNPNAIDYFSSTVNYPHETSSAASETTEPTTSTTTYKTESNYVSDYKKLDQSKEYISSTELFEQTPTTTHRPRLKQRIYPNRYHQSKHTTEKENVDPLSHKTSTRFPPTPENTHESSTHSADMLTQSTENHESSKADVKPHRRRRPNRPHTNNIVTPVTEVSSGTNRYLRTRPTRHPSTITERYRARRPTTGSESTETLHSEWSTYNNFVPSASASNDINNPVDNHNSEQKFSSNQWTDSNSENQNQVPEESSTTEGMHSKTSAGGIVNENTLWLSSSKQSPLSEFSAYQPTVQHHQFTIENGIENQTEIVSERKDESFHLEVKNTSRKPLKGTHYAEQSSTVSTDEIKENFNNEQILFDGNSKAYQPEMKKDRFLTKDTIDNQKKAYDPQDEKKTSGKRRLAFVRRIRLHKRPQDVLETAESQSLGRITDNTLQSSDSKVFSKTEENDDLKPKLSPITTSTTEEYILSTEASIGETRMPATTTFNPSMSVNVPFTTISNEADEYAMQNDFAQMLSDFLNSNDQSTKTVNNLERNNASTENSIGYILSLSNNDNRDNIIINSSPSIVFSTGTPNEVTNADDVINITNSPTTNFEYPDHSTTAEELAETYIPNKFLATSTTTEISLETEICYRGKCVKTKKNKPSDLLPIE